MLNVLHGITDVNKEPVILRGKDSGIIYLGYYGIHVDFLINWFKKIKVENMVEKSMFLFIGAISITKVHVGAPGIDNKVTNKLLNDSIINKS